MWSLTCCGADGTRRSTRWSSLWQTWPRSLPCLGLPLPSRCLSADFSLPIMGRSLPFHCLPLSRFHCLFKVGTAQPVVLFMHYGMQGFGARPRQHACLGVICWEQHADFVFRVAQQGRRGPLLGQATARTSGGRLARPVRHLPLPCVSTAFVAKTLPFRAVLSRVRRGDQSPQRKKTRMPL